MMRAWRMAGLGWMAALFVCVAHAQTAAIPAAKAPSAGNTPNAGSVTEHRGEALDRVVAVVNGELVLESDVDEERRLMTFQPFRDPSGAFSRDQAIERLIDRTLILEQAKLQAEAPITDAAVNAELETLRKDIPVCKEYKCETDAGWQGFLKDHGFTEEQLKTRWRERMEVLRYIEMRFRMGIRITPQEIRTYYEQTMLPEYAKQNVQPPKLEAVSDRIQEVLLQQQVSSLLADWLKSLRAQGSVLMMKPGEMAP